MGTIAIPDSDLVEASRRGELDAFGRLVARYQDVVCAVSYSSTGDRALSEDVAQETFVAAWRQIDRARPATLRQWLCGIARNLGRKARRKTRRETPLEDEMHAAATTPFDDLARADAERVVREALARVPENYREVLVLYYRENQSIRDVATTLGLGEDAVTQRLSRGRRYLADSVTALVERSLRDTRSRRDLVACVLAAIAALAIPARVEASPSPAKGSTMLKLGLAASAIAVVGTTAYLLHDRGGEDAAARAAKATAPALHYGKGIAHAPSLAPSTTPRAVAARAVTTADDLPYMPGDADVVVGVDLAQLRGSSLWQLFVQPALTNNPEIEAITEQCGFDPIASAQSVSMAVKDFGDTGVNAATIVVHGYDKAKALACANKQSIDGVSINVSDGIVMIDGADMHLGAIFVDDATIVKIGPTPISRDELTKAAAGNGGLGNQPTFTPLFANVDPTDPVWLVVTDASPMIAEMNKSMAPFTSIQVHGVFGSVNVSDVLAFHGGIHVASPEVAAQTVTEAKTQLDQLASEPGGTQRYFEQIDVTSDGSDVLVDATVNVAELMAGAASGVVEVKTN
jgi:RNA polymerase sigma factor (sigma-70 family)